jgi:hypothetical protein
MFGVPADFFFGPYPHRIRGSGGTNLRGLDSLNLRMLDSPPVGDMYELLRVHAQ